MLKRLSWLCRSPAVVVAAVLLLSGAYFGSTKDFGAFLLSIPILAILLLGALISSVWAAFHEIERDRAAVATVLICLTPLAYFCSYGAAQRLRFVLWAPAHYRELALLSEKDGIIAGWDSWGMAGDDTFSYLVVDTQDQLASKARAEQWTKEIGQSCGLWRAQRMWPRLYVVTTYTNCPYDGVQPAG